MRTLGIDPGSRRVGLAVSDPDGMLAQPLCTVQVRSNEQAARDIAAIAREREVSRVVIGLPLQLDGTEGMAARGARRLERALGTLLEVELVLWDERLSSVQAERSLIEAGVRRDKRKQVVDQAAAALVLQSYLDSQRDIPWTETHPEHPTEPYEPSREALPIPPPRPAKGGRQRAPHRRSGRRGRGSGRH